MTGVLLALLSLAGSAAAAWYVRRGQRALAVAAEHAAVVAERRRVADHDLLAGRIDALADQFRTTRIALPEVHRSLCAQHDALRARVDSVQAVADAAALAAADAQERARSLTADVRLVAENAASARSIAAAAIARVPIDLAMRHATLRDFVGRLDARVTRLVKRGRK